MERANRVVLAVIAVSVAVGGCHTVTRKSSDSISPAETLQSAYLAANAGRYAEAEQYLAPEVRTAIEKRWANRGGVKAAWDNETRNGSVDKIEILKEDIRGDNATLSFRLHFKDGSTRDDHGPLIKRAGVWRIAPSQ